MADAADNCPAAPNPAQGDADVDTLGDACDVGDADGDGVADRDDRCPGVPNQSNDDSDADGIPDACDVCPRDANADPAQSDTDADGLGEPCSAGQGVCRVEGVVSCLVDGTVGCDARAGAPGLERCNGLDDDCDGVVDPPPCGDLAPIDYAILIPILSLLLNP